MSRMFFYFQAKGEIVLVSWLLISNWLLLCVGGQIAECLKKVAVKLCELNVFGMFTVVCTETQI